MARAIIRSSINGPSGNPYQSQLRKLLEAEGMQRIGTGAYEGDFPDEVEAMDAVTVALDFLRSLPPRYSLDHLWVYVDEDDRAARR